MAAEELTVCLGAYLDIQPSLRALRDGARRTSDIASHIQAPPPFGMERWCAIALTLGIQPLPVFLIPEG